MLTMCNLGIDKFSGMTLEVFKNMQWAFVRVTSFVVGMFIAPYVKSDLKVNSLLIIILPVCLYVIVHAYVDANLFMGWCLVLPIATIFCFVLEKTQSKLNHFIKWMGVISLESYLYNIYLCGTIRSIVNKWDTMSTILSGHYLEYTVIIVLGLLLSYITHRFSDIIIVNKNSRNEHN